MRSTSPRWSSKAASSASPTRRRSKLLGGRIEGRDIRLAIRHPQALERILAHAAGEIDVTGIAEPGRSWRLVIRHLGGKLVLVRMIDRSDVGFGREDAGRFRRQRES